MNTTSKKHEDVLQSFNSLFENLTEQDILDNEARLLMFRFLDIIDRKREGMGWTRKQLAEQLGTSASYITQLYRGDKLVNMTFLAKTQNVLGIRFDVSEVKSYQEQTSENFDLPVHDRQGYWVWKNLEPNYGLKENLPPVEQKQEAA